ncbi:hypothetical protein JCM6292_2948 [Bacteroides pyogenes JCM 6292]|uniref:Uncharacterized protein n=2 Tax=Bacteroides pyogenes TaxID=310300 RepID=W4PJB7_9BACE|nr:hypothetical protein JCM6292_2948 [Bacteroides pyogenes JCM 6292]GAE19877.1 hypothetical protein JCM6294_2990 [Bacteroides pyogenes DSM 20611 = JCM 6294]
MAAKLPFHLFRGSGRRVTFVVSFIFHISISLIFYYFTLTGPFVRSLSKCCSCGRRIFRLPKQDPGFQQVERKTIITSLQIHRRQHLTPDLHKGPPAFIKKESQSQHTANTCLTTFCISSFERLPALIKKEEAGLLPSAYEPGICEKTYRF